MIKKIREIVTEEYPDTWWSFRRTESGSLDPSNDTFSWRFTIKRKGHPPQQITGTDESEIAHDIKLFLIEIK